MRLLFDQNLSRRLTGLLSNESPNSVHVTEVGLDTATDSDIWAYAREHGLAIVSKDSDFRQLAFLYGPPPKAIWIRLGNANTAEVCAALRRNLDEVARFVADADEALRILP